MKKIFKHSLPNYEWDEIKIIDTDKGEFTKYFQERKIGFPFNKITMDIVKDMGYESVKDCLKGLKHRGLLGKEVDYKVQKQSEKTGLINLGVYRINKAGRVNTLDFNDAIESLAEYGLGYCDAQNQIIATYENSL